MAMTTRQKKEAERLLRSGVGTKETARRIGVRPQAISRVRKAIGLGLGFAVPSEATGRSSGPSAPGGPPPAATEASEATSGPVGKQPQARQRGKSAQERYAALARRRLPLRERLAHYEELARQKENPQARIRALERLDILSGFLPEAAAVPDPTPLFALPPDTMLPFVACDQPPTRKRDLPGWDMEPPAGGPGQGKG